MALYNPILVTIPVEAGSQIATRMIVTPPATITDSKQLIGVNPSRKGLVFFNKSDGIVYVGYGTAPTATNHSFSLESGGYYELPYLFKGAIIGLWSVAGGTGVILTEFT